MRLSARILKNVANVNQWEYANQAHIQEGQINVFYFQLVDLDKIPEIDQSLALPNFPLRLMPQGTTIGVKVTFPVLDLEESSTDDDEFTKTAVQAFTDDKSIWKVTLASNELPGTGSFKVKLTIDGVDQFFLVNNSITVNLLEAGDC